MVTRRGDTLVEIAFAIGIFSLVAIAVVSVINGSTSNAQSALELTITREEIDSQAEAIRFIQTSLIAGGNVNTQNNTKYKVLWDKITAHAIDLSKLDSSQQSKVLNYNPNTCDDIYNKDYLSSQNAFIIDTHNLGLKYDRTFKEDGENVDINKIIVDQSNKNVSFIRASTYPRIFYGGPDALLLENHNENADLKYVEGIFVIAVKDNKSSTVVSGNNASSKKSAYYDFYIRTCWYNPGASRPSTISTVIRLQDPAIIEY